MNAAQTDARDRLWAAIDQRVDELTEITSELVRRPSLLGAEAEAQAYVAEHLAGSGMAVESYDLDDGIKVRPNAGDSLTPFPGRPNVGAKRPSPSVSLRAGSGGGRSLILNGHIDVVSPEPVAAWSHDPWAAEIVDGKMFGRGAYDMKSGVALNLFLARLVADLGIQLGGDLTIHSVIEEECTGNGALAASLRDRADACLVTEPHFDGYTRAHPGVIWFRISVPGVSAHAGWAWKGVNAIVNAVPVLQAMAKLNDDLNLDIHPIWEGMHHPINLNVGTIEGGDWPSTVPGSCEIRCRTSFFPGTTVEEMQSRISGAITEAIQPHEWLREHPPVVSYDGFRTEGVILDDGEPMVAVLGDAFRTVMGKEMAVGINTAVTDQRYYSFAGTPATCFGAAGGNGHAADEWLDLASMPVAAKVIAQFIVDWCGVTG